MAPIYLTDTVSLRNIQPKDHPKHLELMQRIYPPAFSYLWPDGGDWYVDKVHSEAAFLSDLATPDAPYKHVYFKDKLIGIYRLKLNNPNPDFPDEPTLKIDRLYLDDAVRGNGIGSILITHAKAETLRQGKQLLWLERMDTNEATIRFYRKHDFMDGSTFRLPFVQMYEKFRGMRRLWWRP
jgi:ribosomal protein S18 acetylase RimI-like enzyme